jgi:hypothetical protein
MDPITNKHAVTPQTDGYDKGEPKSWFIAVLGLGTIVILVAVILGVQFYFDHVSEQQVYQKQMVPIFDDLRNVRAKEDAELHSYQYIDRNAGVVRLPIERGIELLAQEAAEGKLKYPSKPTPVVVALPGAPAPAAQQGAANAPLAATPAR